MRDVDPSVLGETPERAHLRAVLREFFASTADDGVLWDRLAKEIGVQGLAIPEEYGGSGFSFADLAIALEEAGRALACAPLLSTTVLATYTLLLGADPPARDRYLPAIAAGNLTATVAGFGPGDRPSAEPGADGWVGTGRADFVLDGAGADLILIAARTGAGLGLFACEPGGSGGSGAAGAAVPAAPAGGSGAAVSAGLVRTARPVLDGTRPQALLVLRQTPLTPIAPPGAAAAIVERVLDIGRAALAAEQVGGSAHALAATVSYVGQRRQFGRPIGSFQAVQAPAGRPAGRRRGGAVGGGVRRGVRHRIAGRTAGGGQRGHRRLLRYVPAGRGRVRPVARRHRVHLGAPGPPVSAPRALERGAVRYGGRAPHAAGWPARPGDLTADRRSRASCTEFSSEEEP